MSDASRSVRGERRPPVSGELPRLKRDGCNLFVSGCVSEATANDVSRRLLGSSRLERTRLVIQTAETPAVADLLPRGVTSDDPSVSVFEYSNANPDPLAALLDAVRTAIDAFGSRSVASVGGELRVVLSSLDPLFSRHSTNEVLWFLGELTRCVAAARGMGHYRYAGSADDLSALPLESLFDGFVDLRETTRAEHRLSIPDVGSTAYVSL